MGFIANALRLLRTSQGRPFVSGILQFAYSLPSGFSRRKKKNCKLNSGFFMRFVILGKKQSYNYGFHSERIKIASYLARMTVCVGYFAICLFIAVRLQPTEKKELQTQLRVFYALRYFGKEVILQLWVS
ncbi:hypothetical protein ASE92_17495 [Pedobacter sp. Leaf41]|nr:hypothetical protein ASE92_17495 [Pedobacter sp. Leaf41]